ncbi:MAG: FHA domain-containing protein [Chloroflexota bacterium]
MSNASFFLVMKSGPSIGKKFPLDRVELSVGRETGNDITISDAEISRRHALLTRQPDGRYALEDLGSTNGTFVNGKRLTTTHILRAGDTVMFGGNVSLTVEGAVFDQEATMVSAPEPAVREPRVRPPVAAPPPPPPPPEAVEGPEKKRFPTWLMVGCGILLVVCCIVGGVLWYIDTNYLWCEYFLFLPGC